MIPVVLLCGGSGTRLREQTEFIPKPMVQIGKYPMCIHIMKWYAKFGYTDFILALGYKQDIFKQYFSHYDVINNDITVHIGTPGNIHFEDSIDWGWTVTLADTGLNTMKGGRLKRIEKYIEGDTFMMTYGDGLANVDLDALLAFHQSHGKLMTVTGVHPMPRFGELRHNNGAVLSFEEKPDDDHCTINGGFMVCNRGIFDYLTEDEWCDLEQGPMELIAAKGQLQMFPHKGFWRCCDTLRDLDDLQKLWDEGRAPWRV